MRTSIMIELDQGGAAQPVGRMIERRGHMDRIVYYTDPWDHKEQAGVCRRATPQEARRIRALEKRTGKMLPEIYA